MSYSQGSIGAPQPTSSGGSTGTAPPPRPLTPGAAQAAAAAAAAATPLAPMLVSKVLTYSDVSTEVARTGRIVLPRIQVQSCLPELLRLCGAEHALPPAARNGGAAAAAAAAGAVRLSVDLHVLDEAGRCWSVLLKTWQNVVSGEHRPTFVLENTADFVRANRLAQGGTLAFCPTADGRMLLRTSLPADQLLPRAAKRGGNAAAAAARRRAAAAHPPARRTPEPAPAWPAQPAAGGGRKRKAPGFYAELAPELAPAELAPAPAGEQCWPSAAPYDAEEAALALLEMHSAPSPDSSASEQLALSSGELSDGQHGGPAARAAKAPRRAGSTSPPLPLYRPQPLQQQPQQQQQRQPAAGVPVHAAFCPQALQQAAQALTAVQQQGVALPALLAAPPLSTSGAAAASGSLPAEALVQARAWLGSILAQQEQERAWLQQYNRVLLWQALQAQHQQQEQLAAAAAAGLHA